MKPHGLPRERRVRSRGDFQRAYAEGTKVVTRRFVLFARENGGELTRLGVTATRKTGNAVVRNRARRLVKEAFRSCQAQLPGGLDLVVVVRPPLLSASPSELSSALLRATARLAEGYA